MTFAKGCSWQQPARLGPFWGEARRQRRVVPRIKVDTTLFPDSEVQTRLRERAVIDAQLWDPVYGDVRRVLEVDARTDGVSVTCDGYFIQPLPEPLAELRLSARVEQSSGAERSSCAVGRAIVVVRCRAKPARVWLPRAEHVVTFTKAGKGTLVATARGPAGLAKSGHSRSLS